MRRLAVLLLAACAAAPDPVPPAPLAIRERLDVAYTGAVSTARRCDLLGAERAAPAPSVADRPQLAIGTRVLRLRPEDARQLFDLGGEPAGAGGGITARPALDDAIERLLAGGAASLVDSPQFVVEEGHWGRAAIVRQGTLVDRFELQSTGVRFVADPVIESFEVGFVLHLRASGVDADGSLDLEVDLVSAELLGELRNVVGNLDGDARIGLNVPMVCEQTLRAHGRVARDESMFLTGVLVPGSTDVLVAILDASVAEVSATR